MTDVKNQTYAGVGPVRPVTLSESVYENLLKAIVSGKITAGKVISEVSLAREFQVSRTPVREALQLLSRDGLVKNSVNRRATVADFSREDILEIYQVREGLEAMAAGLACERMAPGTLEELCRNSHVLDDAESSVILHRAIILDEDFHRTIAAASGNRRLERELTRCSHLICICRRFSRSNVAHLRKAHLGHLKVLAALEARDPLGARAAMAQHIREAVEMLLMDLFCASADREK